ncbi:hypothetical protein C8J56DRAFT_881923 [Mycena floridula]|nr:hypothetical protein C8J56DRAFT_881923 [Mycena floridula]
MAEFVHLTNISLPDFLCILEKSDRVLAVTACVNVSKIMKTGRERADALAKEIWGVMDVRFIQYQSKYEHKHTPSTYFSYHCAQSLLHQHKFKKQRDEGNCKDGRTHQNLNIPQEEFELRSKELPEGTKLATALRNLRKQEKEKAQKIMYRTTGTATYAAMNINSKKGDSINDSEHKWRNIRDLIMMNKVAALAILETKMTDEQVGEIEQSIYGKDLEIFTTTGDNPNSGRVAVVFNKLLTDTKGITSYEIIPGWVLYVTHLWHGAETEVILAVYAPTEKPQNGEFYQEILSIWRKYKLPIPTKVMGDMNVTVDMLDRLPHKLDKKSSRDAHIEFRNAFDMNDGWRNTHLQMKEYTYSRINKKVTQIRFRQWHIHDWAGGIVDHRLNELELLNNGLGGLTEPNIVLQKAWHDTKSDWLKMEKECCKLKTGTDRTPISD